MRRKKLLIKQLIAFLLFVAIGYGISYYNLVIFVPTPSMSPTIDKRTVVKAKRLSEEEKRNITYGDIIVFKAPKNKVFRIQGLIFVKRVVGLGGDFLEIKQEGNKFYLYRNSKKVEESYVVNWTTDFEVNRLAGVSKYIVPKGQIYLMGDNRGQSVDSRFWGSIPLANVRGIVKKE